MTNSETVQSLLESTKMYQMIRERLDLIEPTEVFNMESEIMELILEFYSGDESDLPVEKLQKLSMLQVMHYLQASHKLYISKTLPEIEQSMLHIQRRYDESPEILNALVLFFNDYKTHFLEHIRMEEREFFPYLKKLHQAHAGELSAGEIQLLLKNASLSQFIDHHDAVEDELRQVSTIIHQYAEEEVIPLPFKVFMNQVDLFEMDLRKHAIIEDHVLVPMAQRIEQELRQRSF